MTWHICGILALAISKTITGFHFHEKLYTLVPIETNENDVFLQNTSKPIHSILKYGIYYDFMDR